MSSSRALPKKDCSQLAGYSGRSQSMSKPQIEYLVDYMVSHSNFARRDDLGPSSNATCQKMWKRLAEKISNIGPSVKTVKQLQMYWNRLCASCKDRNAAIAIAYETNRQSRQQHSQLESAQPSALTEIEKKVISVIGYKTSERLANGRSGFSHHHFIKKKPREKLSSVISKGTINHQRQYSMRISAKSNSNICDDIKNSNSPSVSSSGSHNLLRSNQQYATQLKKLSNVMETNMPQTTAAGHHLVPTFSMELSSHPAVQCSNRSDDVDNKTTTTNVSNFIDLISSSDDEYIETEFLEEEYIS